MARAQGISRLCNVDECRRLCPDVKLVHVQTIDKDGLTEKPSRSAKVRNTTPPTHVPYHLSLGDVCMTRTLYTRVLQVTLERYRVERLVLAELSTVWVASTSLAFAYGVPQRQDHGSVREVGGYPTNGAREH